MDISVIEIINLSYELLNKGKEKKAWQKIAKWEKSEHLTLKEHHIYKIFKGYILRLTGKYQESLVIAEELYQENINQNNTVYAIDALILKASNLFLLGRFVKMGVSVMLCDTMFKSVLQELNKFETEWRKALIWLLGGFYVYHINEFDNALKRLNISLKIIKEYDILSLLLPLNLEALGFIYTAKGELDLALKFHKESLSHSRGEYVEKKND